MTPFGAKVRALRAARGVSLQEMAAELKVSAAYLSALEHGRRGRPSAGLIHQICEYFDIIWDDADELRRLAELSHPRAVIDTGGLTPEATELANRLAETIELLAPEALQRMLDEVKRVRE
jgi:transcriptional regulator with XRE-family HTH domain